MAKKEKRREADFTRKEMKKLTNCNSESAFDYSLSSTCDHYQLDKDMFKMDSETKSGESYFPAEIGELLALLVRAYKSNPGVKATSKGYSANGIKEYYDEILQNIEGLPQEIKDMVYTLPSHFTSGRISIWTERFLPILTEFVANYMEEKEEDLGALLQHLCVQIDKSNYNLFVNQYYLGLVKKANEKIQEEQYGDMLDYLYGPKGTERDSIQQTLMNQNVSIDIELAKLIKFLMLDAEESKNSIFLDGNDTVKNLSRAEYYKRFLSVYSNPGDVRLKTETLSKYSKGATGWKTIEERIQSEEKYAPENISLSYEEEVKKLEDEISFMRQQLEAAEQQLTNLKSLSEKEKIDRDKKTNEVIDEINKLYIERCQHMREENGSLLDGTDRYVGQVLWKFLNKNEK